MGGSVSEPHTLTHFPTPPPFLLFTPTHFPTHPIHFPTPLPTHLSLLIPTPQHACYHTPHTSSHLSPHLSLHPNTLLHSPHALSHIFPHSLDHVVKLPCDDVTLINLTGLWKSPIKFFITTENLKSRFRVGNVNF